MRKYYIFFLKEDVYIDYYYKSDLLNNFFQMYLMNRDRSDLKEQFHYITSQTPIKLLTLTKQQGVSFDNSFFPINCTQSIIDRITIEDYWIEIECDSFGLSTFLQFEHLDQNCFVIEQGGYHYGWLSPLKRDYRMRVAN